MNEGELREKIVEKLRMAVDRGDLTEEQFDEAMKLIESNMECLIDCPTGATAVICSKGVDPECCPGGIVEVDCQAGMDPDRCTKGIPIDCCPEELKQAVKADCCPNGVISLDCSDVDIQTMQLGEPGDCSGIAVCVKKEAR